MPPVSPALIQKRADLIRAGAREYLAHRFDLLGSGWVHVRHGMTCAGLDGNLYEACPEVKADRMGRWLRGRIDPLNLKESQRIWGLVDSGYQPIDWHIDFKSGYRWKEETWYREIRYGNCQGADVKVPWELARMQHLPLLALAHELSAQEGNAKAPQEEIHAREFRNQVLDFIANNPPRFGVNWSCTMDVAIRAANWLLAYDLFLANGVRFDDAFVTEFTRSIYQHGRHVVENLEWYEKLRANHYLADVAGLLFIAAHLSGGHEPDLWLSFAIQEMVKEMALQFYPEGSNFEASTSYHRLSSEMMIYSTALVLAIFPRRKQGLENVDVRDWKVDPPLEKTVECAADGPGVFSPFPAWYFERLERMAEFAIGYTHASGSIVQVGDNDSGRFVKLLPDFELGDSSEETGPSEDHLDHRGLVAAIDGLFHRSDFAKFSGDDRLEREVIANIAGGVRLTSRLGSLADLEHGQSLGSRDSSIGTDACAFTDFGLYLLKKPGTCVWVHCGPVGQRGNGGHAHHDQLSFELAMDGVPLIVDPGTYVYTPLPETRERFRAASMHNTLILAGKEPVYQPVPYTLFTMVAPETTEVIDFSDHRFTGLRRKDDFCHRRTITVETGIARGTDECTCEGTKLVFFHLHPSIAVHLDPAHTGTVHLTEGTLTFELRGSPGVCKVHDGQYSSSYGVVRPSKVVSLEFAETRCEWTIRRLPTR